MNADDTKQARFLLIRVYLRSSAAKMLGLVIPIPAIPLGGKRELAKDEHGCHEKLSVFIIEGGRQTGHEWFIRG